jgi:hypothetical protein
MKYVGTITMPRVHLSRLKYEYALKMFVLDDIFSGNNNFPGETIFQDSLVSKLINVKLN